MPGRHHDCADDEVRVDEDSSAPFCGESRVVVRGHGSTGLSLHDRQFWQTVTTHDRIWALGSKGDRQVVATEPRRSS